MTCLQKFSDWKQDLPEGLKCQKKIGFFWSGTCVREDLGGKVEQSVKYTFRGGHSQNSFTQESYWS